jgi:hypothetical protein
MILPKSVWNEYFTVSPTTAHVYSEYSSQLSYSSGSVYVLNFLFSGITSGSHGGALYCTTVTHLLIESSSFFTCRTSAKYGGAIFFENTNSGESVLHEVCGYNCYSTYTSSSSWYQFAYTQVNNAASSKNYVNYSSIVRCVNERSDSYYILGLRFGKICCPSVNLSMNKCQWYSGIYCSPLKDSNSVTSSLTYSSFTDIIATGYTCIMLWTTGANYEIKSCNILRNTQVSSSGGTVWSVGNVIIEYSCILENTATYIFNQGDSNYRTTLSNCTVDSTSKSGNVITQSTITKSFIHALNHMSTRNCYSGYDSAGTLTPIIQSPSTLKNQKHCSCGNFLYQYRLSYLVSLTNIFILNFIHPYASGDPFY